ncbi:hypothetical protein G5I_13025 [Acromyrmex echinatior]|uniref:Uncharacterized protein n=1 Tax=Acromyrmex echinatior TaxID=103372 RepID=F4X3W2_ACREC|nr:hypothetical protein G5I_13025 [Acromyrmex echinatior]
MEDAQRLRYNALPYRVYTLGCVKRVHKSYPHKTAVGIQSASIRTTFCETVLAAATTTVTVTDKDGEARAQTTIRSITYPARTSLEQEYRIDRLPKSARKRDTREFGRNDALGNAINYNTELSRDNSVGA